ncbi:MAG: hypothetical protein ACE5MB_10875 [Anaerolineae bacterium]
MIEDRFQGCIAPYWVRFAVGHGRIEVASARSSIATARAGLEPAASACEEGSDSVRFVMEGAVAGQLSDAQIDDYHTRPREGLPWMPPLRMEVRARASHPAGELLGTAGFGFWNDPFVGQQGVAAPPNAVWFFYASPPSDMALVPGVPGHGWKAAMLNGGRASDLTMLLGNWLLGVPGLSRLLYRLARARVRAGEQLLEDVDMAEWHIYALQWLPEVAIFSVDGHEVYRVADPPTVPLGFVAWLDNQSAVVRPGGDFAFHCLAVPHRQWLEVDYVRIEKLPL